MKREIAAQGKRIDQLIEAVLKHRPAEAPPSTPPPSTPQKGKKTGWTKKPITLQGYNEMLSYKDRGYTAKEVGKETGYSGTTVGRCWKGELDDRFNDF